MVSFLIPARNEKYLENTLRDLLKNCRGEIEILVALDGYIPDPQIVLSDNRVTFYHYPTSIGQRQSVNELARKAKGDFICKLDAHCAVDEGFDVKMSEVCEPDWTMVPRMYNLDVDKWLPKWNKVTDYMYFTSPSAEKPFRMEYFTGKDYRERHANPLKIDDVMCCVGCCWFLRRDRFFEQGGCDEGHGSWGNMSIEVALKAWLSGGSFKVNKNTWFAHYFRSGGIGFPYEISGRDIEKARQYSRDLWLNDKWDKATRKLQWVIDKFNPPTWGTTTGVEELKDKHKGETCYIVGKGYSLLNITPEHFKEGVVITINSAIEKVEKLNLPNVTYAMLKERQNVIPQSAVVLVSKHESPEQLIDYKPRYVFDAEVLAPSPYGYKEFSANCALKLAQYMGCSKIKLLCFDACTTGEKKAVDGDKVYNDPKPDALLRQCKRMNDLIKKEGLDVEWITP